MMRFGMCLALMLGAACAARQPMPRPLAVPGAVFKYTVEGSGPPVVAFTGSENIGHRLYTDRLRKRIAIIHADPSDLEGERLTTLTMSSVVDDIEMVRRALRVEKIGVMGHSMFAPVALEYALQYPEHTSWSILSGALPFNTSKAFRTSEEYWAAQASPERKAIREANRKALAKRDQTGKSATDRFWDAYEADVPFRFANPRFEFSQVRRAMTSKVNVDFINQFWTVLLKDRDRTSEYHRIRTPVLVIAGQYDFSAPYFLWSEVGKTIPNYSFHLFHNAGHNPMLEVPDEFDRVVINWIERNR